MMIKQTIILLGLAVLFGLGSNLISPNKISYVGDYRDLSSGDGPIIPPTAAEDDPAFIAIDVAVLEHGTNGAVFVDARDPEEFNCGTIPGSVNLPFEYLPEENLEAHIDSVLNKVGFDMPLIVFCSGEECDLSLHLGRNLQIIGYTKVMIFFGGAREWENNELDMERREDCGS